jgi:hypothetical protein
MSNRLIKMVLVSFLMGTTFLYSQSSRSKKIEGEYQMILPDDLSYAEAKVMAITHARIEALKAAFGEVVIQGNTTYLRSIDQNDKVDSKQLFNLIADSYVNGEWIKDRQAPLVSIEQKADFDEVWIRAKVKGYGKPLPERLISFEFSFFSELGNNANSTQSFSEGDNFYLKFKASQSGYLYLFMDDLENQTTSTIFPLEKEITGYASTNFVEENQRLLLFHENSSNAKYELGAYKSKKKPLETVKIYILFSPKTPLLLPDDSKLQEERVVRSGEYSILPFNSMPMEAFQSWLHTLRAKNKSLQYDWSIITIK